MKNKAVIQLLVLFLMLQSCTKKSASEFNSDPNLYKSYISNYTFGIIPAKTDIKIVLAFNKKEWKKDEILDNDLLDISPKVDGKIVALSSNTLAFIPEKKLKQNTEYQITFNLSKLIKTPNELSEFRFTVKTIKQDFIINTQDIQSYNKNFQYLNGTLKTADAIDFETAQKLIAVNQKGKKLSVKFDKVVSTSTEFKFIIDSIQRYDEDSVLDIAYDGSDFDIDQKGVINYTVISKNNFVVVGVEVVQDETQTVLINFSDPLRKDQDFKGLVSIQNANNLKFAVDGNLLKVFYNKDAPSEIQSDNSVVAEVDEYSNSNIDGSVIGDLLLEVYQGIESEYGFKLKETYSTTITFDQIKPEIRLLKNGTILPSSNNLKLNFEAVNLNAVDIRVYKIYKNNILQFLQENELNGANNLRRVAQPIAKTKLILNKNKLVNTSKWNSYALDLSKIITPEPGAIYRVEFLFKKEYSLYRCDTSTKNEKQNEQEEEINENDVNYSIYSYGDDYYNDDYDWRESENPCFSSYYYDKKIGTNILASDLGVIAKRGENKSYFFAVNNIVTTEPISNAKIELYTFQQQKITTGTTNSEGIAEFQLQQFAYFAIVTVGNQSTYVKLDDANSLSISNFDVAGEALQKGLKGYIYGERGVWRPGDHIYLSFMLNDVANKLPKSHPIKFSLSDPQGKLMYQAVQKTNPYNLYVFDIKTTPDAPTGNWEAKISVGGAKFYKSVKIETIKPNRLKIKNTFKNKVLSSSYPNTSDLSVTWLHGAIAKNLKAEMQAKFSQQVTTFKGYDKYVFDDLTRNFSTEEINIFSGKLDENGKASVNIDPKLKGLAPGMLKASFITKVYEEGGDFSTDVMSTTYSPYHTYVGIKSPEPNKYGMLETQTKNRFDIVTLDENGRPKAVQNLEIKIYKVEWRWWWDASNDNLSNFNASNSTTSYKTFVVNTDASGKGSFQFSLDDDEWGRYLIRVSDPESGHVTSKTVLIDWPIWSGKTRNSDASTANMLVFSTDKKNYAVGEKTEISFPSSEGGRALISIENGSKVIQTLWVLTKKGETKVSIPITGAMAPNVYFNISLLQPHASTKNDSPIRMYGIVPIEVVDKNTILEPKINMPEVLKPEQTFDLKISEKSGKPMTYTIAIVDDGLLDLTRFKTPNAWDNFYTREALGVKTWDVYDDVIGAYGGKINQIFSIGGDQDLGGGKAKKANRFKPVVIFLGPFNLPKNQTQIHKVKLPKYIGSVRTMVVAGDASTSAYGNVEKTTPVRSPLMTLASLPRKISPNEKVTLPVTIFAMEKNIKNVSVQVKVSKGLKIIGNSTQNLSFDQPDEKMVYFNLEVGNETGIGTVEITSKSGSNVSTYKVEIDLTNPNPVTTTFTEVVLEPNSTKTIAWKTFGVNGSNKAQLEVSSMPSINFNGRLQYLIDYPHGCVEQTTSAVFPQLYLNDIVDIDANRKQKIQRNVTAGINRLGGMQLSNGGFSYWPGNSYADDWGTSYAGHFLMEAERKGYVLPISFKQKWIKYQQKEAKNWRLQLQFGNDLAQAYRLYTLALAGIPDLSSMNRLRETAGISNESKIRLAAAYVLAGQKSTGMSLLAKSNMEETRDNYNYYYYGSNARNRAMFLETLILLGQKQKAFDVANKLAKNMSSSEWMSTQTSAYCLYAMSKFAEYNGGKGIEIQWSKDGKSETVKTNKSIADRTVNVKTGGNNLVLKNNKNNTIYVRVLNSGILPVGQEQVVQSNLSAKIIFKNRKGEILDISKIKQGTEFIAEATITNLQNDRVENVALSQILPSGFEIENTRFTDYGDATENIANYINIRDDRANFYFDMKSRETKTFKLLLNASYLGNYYFPGLQCEAMYDHNFLVRTKGFWIEVLK